MDGYSLQPAKDETIKLWNVATGHELATLRGLTNWVSSVAFSPDGKKVVSGSYDNTIKLWGVATGKEQETLKGHSDDVTKVTFSLDGELLVSGSRQDGQAVASAIK
jgi:WD40 repeat protein